MVITPAKAQEWPNLNTHNRPIRRKHVNFLADEIINNRWKITHQGIALNEEHLIDGQHRLLAIVKAGKPVTCMVTTNAESSTQDVVDSGSMRSIPDQLHLNNNLVNAALIVAACRHILILCTNGSNLKMSIGLVKIILAEFGREFEVILPIREQFKPARNGWTIGTLAFAYSANRQCRSFIDDFYSGEHLTSEMQAKIARDWIINRKPTKHNYSSSLKLLNAASNFLKKSKSKNISDGNEGLLYFQEKKQKFVNEIRAEVMQQMQEK